MEPETPRWSDSGSSLKKGGSGNLTLTWTIVRESSLSVDWTDLSLRDKIKSILKILFHWEYISKKTLEPSTFNTGTLRDCTWSYPLLQGEHQGCHCDEFLYLFLRHRTCYLLLGNLRHCTLSQPLPKGDRLSSHLRKVILYYYYLYYWDKLIQTIGHLL